MGTNACGERQDFIAAIFFVIVATIQPQSTTKRRRVANHRDRRETRTGCSRARASCQSEWGQAVPLPTLWMPPKKTRSTSPCTRFFGSTVEAVVVVVGSSGCCCCGNMGNGGFWHHCSRLLLRCPQLPLPPFLGIELNT